jgi:RimJ/RimL family protein N-acetyltransferase
MKVIETERLILRTWQEDDALPYSKINQDPKVIEFLRGPMTLDDAKEFIQRHNDFFATQHMCFFAAELKATGELIGFIGLQAPYFAAHFTPCIEIGWRLAAEHWGKGYAPEGAHAVLDYAFNKMKLKEIVAYTVPANVRSIRVMEKIGMQRDINGDFAHPGLPANHKLSHHVLYRISSNTYQLC